jgi:pimeloyl-ACP methyl ester carboxylesterase
MGAFVRGLVDAGFKVVAFDAPGHGLSPGNSTNIFQIKDVLLSIEKHVGPIYGVIAHSFGVLAITLAMSESLTASRAVCISSPTSAEFLVDRFVRAMHVPGKTIYKFKVLLEENFGADVWKRISAKENARGLTTSALIIHDENDLDVPWELGKQLAEAWPGSSLLVTRGLGHRRILRNRKVINATIEFLTKQ